MSDDVVCRYPLPHHQDARFQTKDLAGFALGGRWITGMLDDYEIALYRPSCIHGTCGTLARTSRR